MWWLPLLVPLTQGTPDDADPAVVAIVDAQSGALHCSGTLIAERVVLTAAHCNVQLDPSAYRVFFGAQVGDTGNTVEIIEAVAHPDADDSSAHDIALVLLADAAPAPPITASSSAPPAQLRLVGFGDTSGTALDGGRKREGTTAVTSSTPFAIELGADPSLPCSGDSGGPALANGEVVAVVSRGDPACAAYGKATRVDAHQDFIAPYVAATAAGTVAVGDRCKYDAHCESGSCVVAADEPLISYCSEACSRDSDCPGTMYCIEHACRYDAPTPGAIGAACESNDECVRGECLVDDGYCSVRCVTGRDDCPAGFACAHEGGVDFFCELVIDDDGCCDTGDGTSGGSAFALVGLVFAISRLRRARDQS